MDTDPPTAADQPPLFRPSKKRKIYRQRATSPPLPTITPPTEAATTATAPLPHPFASASTNEDDDAPSTAAIRRLLATRRQRIGGVEFRASSPRGADNEAEEGEGEGVVIVRRDSQDAHDEGESAGGLAMGGKRFVTQTGMSAEGVDRHMMAYIDSELAKRRKPAGSTDTSTSTPTPFTATTTAATTTQSQHHPHPSPPYQTASRGKLLEIELPPSLPPPPPTTSTRPPRLSRNGQPLRGKKRRTEADIRRDALVEAVMRENGLGIYEPPTAPTVGGQGEGGEGDEEIAERFRREFLEGVEERRRGGGGGGGGGGKGKGGKEEEGLKGPKLGGSRSARAGVREALLKAERGKR
ncbi:hypothetical protein VE03_03971 [Pseudogymnoascus sp. 23342-1-I1]|nr:hypothetical protein VE03_03971 [Pseudogymnoascus sp. 23342-1-I1]